MNIIEHMIGLEAFDALRKQVGGTDYRVPSSPDCDSGRELAGWIGPEAARKLIGHAGGDTLYVNGANESVLRSRYAEIMRLHAQGKSPAQISREYRFVAGYSERQVWAILAGDRKQAEAIIRQGDLFL